MLEDQSNKPVTLIHYTSQGGTRAKILAKEIVKPGSPSARFLRKMEANRLSQPCYKVIDKRKQQKQDCYAYEHNNIIHYLDDESIELFEELIYRNKGLYSEAIYTALTSPAAVRPKSSTNQKEITKTRKEYSGLVPGTGFKNQKGQRQGGSEPESATDDFTDEIAEIDIIPFGYHLHQHEIRMNYVSKITVINAEHINAPNKTAADNRIFSAKTIDVSISGIRIKLTENLPVNRNDIVEVIFDDLAMRASLPEKKQCYRVVDFYKDGSFFYRLERVLTHTDDHFSYALSKFIQTHKRRYKIDLEDFKSATRSQVYETIYAQSTQQIPLFFCRNSARPVLRYRLITRAMEKLIKHENMLNFINSSYLSFITQKLPLKKIHRSLLAKQKQSSYISPLIITIHACIINKNKHYIAFDTGKKQSKKLNKFISIAKHLPEYKKLELIIRPASINKIDQSLDLTSLSNTESDTLVKEVKDIFLMGLLSMVQDNSSSSRHLNNINKTFSIADLNPENRQVMHHFHLKSFSDYDVESIKTTDKIHRSENRYQLTTAVAIHYNKQNIAGHSIDFSPNGIKIKLEHELIAKIRDEVDISFINLQKKFPDEQLLNQHYRLTHLSDDKKLACFTRDHRFILHEASLFFRKIIERNQHKLTTCCSDQLMMIRSRFFEQMLTHNLCITPLFMAHNKSKLLVDSVAHDEFPSSLLQFFQQNKRIAIQGIFTTKVWDAFQNHLLNTAWPSFILPPLFIVYEKKEDQSISTLLITDQNSPRDKNRLLFERLNPKQHFVMKITFCKTIPYREKEIADELNEIRHNSKADFDHFLSRIRSIKFIAEVTDMTGYYLQGNSAN